jgi:hypothetical protein
MNNPDHISESLKTIFWIKILKFFGADPGSGMEKFQIRDKHPDPQHWFIVMATPGKDANNITNSRRVKVTEYIYW